MGALPEAFLQGFGVYQQQEAAAGAASYNAKVAKINAQQATENAVIASQSGAAQAGQQGLKTRAEVGAIKTNQAAAGVDVNQDSAVQTRASASELGALDALTIRSNAAREAYGYQTQSESFKEQGILSQYEAKADKQAAIIGGTSTFLGSLESSAENYAKFAMSGGFGG